MGHLVARIQQLHPDTSSASAVGLVWKTHGTRCWKRIAVCPLHPDGINMIGYSQGGLLGRAVLQTYPNHCVRTFISLSSPQGGQFGADFLHLIFPSLVAKTAYQLFYTHVGSTRLHHQDQHFPYVNSRLPSTYRRRPI